MTRRPAGRVPGLLLLAVVVLSVLAACGCGRKAKPEPLWSAARTSAITDRSR